MYINHYSHIFYNEETPTGRYSYRVSWLGKLILQAEYNVHRVVKPRLSTTGEISRTFLRKVYKDVKLSDMIAADAIKLVKDKK